MKRELLMGVGGLALLFVVAGCASDATTSPSGVVPLVRTNPTEGATGIPVTAMISMALNEPVDTLQFHNYFFCLPEDRQEHLHDSMMGGGHMGMGPGHGDSDEYYHELHDESMPGHFAWNADGDSCTFQPTEEFLPNMDYVMTFRGGMHNNHGGMMQHMGNNMDDDFMVHFRTGQDGGI